MQNPSRSRNYPDDWTAQGCTINNPCVDHSLQRDKNHRQPAEAESLEPTHQAGAPWPEPMANNAPGSAASQLHPAAPQKLPARHPSLLYQATLIFPPLSHSAQSLQPKNFPFFFFFPWWEMRQCLDLQMPKDLVIWSSSLLIYQMGQAHFVCYLGEMENTRMKYCKVFYACKCSGKFLGLKCFHSSSPRNNPLLVQQGSLSPKDDPAFSKFQV